MPKFDGDTNKGGPPLGNKNAVKNRPWAAALKRALARHAKGDLHAGLDTIADKVVAQAVAGDQTAWQEIGNRMDGRAIQQLEHSGIGGGAIPIVTAEKLAGMSDKQLDSIVKALSALGIDPATAEAPD